MQPISQTNLQLYNQLLAQGRSAEELAIVRRAYEFATTIYPGYYQADGKPFVAHSVGVASILTHLGLRADILATGLLHNVYASGDFGDGRRHIVTEERQRMVREAVGKEIESLINRFRQFRITPTTIDEISGRIDQLDQVDRQLLLIDLADYLEKYVDCGVLYFGDSRWITDVVQDFGDRLIEIAGRLGEPKFAAMLKEGFEQAAAAEAGMADALRASHGQKYLQLVVPRSCRRRRFLDIRERLRQRAQPYYWQFHRLKIVRALRGLAGRVSSTTQVRHDQ